MNFNRQLVPDESLRSIIQRPEIQRGVEAAQKDVNDANYNLYKFDKKFGDVSEDPQLQALRYSLEKTISRSEDALDKWNDALEQSTPTVEQALTQFATKLIGFDPVSAFKSAKDFDQNGPGHGGFTGHDAEIAVASKDVAGAFKGIVDAAKTYQEGYAKGGVLGGAGAVAQSFSGLAEAIAPGIGGAIVSSIGSIMSTIGSLFTAAAQHIADQVNRSVALIMREYSEQRLDLSQTIQSLKMQEETAISSLSGVKGGQDQLDKLLPNLEQQISSLEQQARKTIADFETMGADLSLQNDTLSQANQQWQQIVQQVADYLSAGGDAATATQALSNTLHKMQIDAMNSLHQANDTAVQDAINLNGLLTQRLQLTEQYNQQVFAIVNQGSIQRRQGAVTQGEQLAQLAATYAKQLQDLDSQISITQQKVTAESQIFDIAKDINDLHTQDAQLQMDALNYQLEQYKALQKIVSSISQDATGVFSAAPGLFNAMPTTINLELQLAGYTLTATGTIAPGGQSVNSSALNQQLEWQLRQNPTLNL